MSEIANEGPNQDVNPDVGSTPAGSAPAASTGGSLPSTGDADARARAWQSRYDQEVARARALEERLSSLESSTQAPSLSIQDVEAAAARSFLRCSGLSSKVAELRSQHPDVARLRPDLFEDLTRYSNPEALEAAVTSEADSLRSLFEERLAEREKQIADEYAKQYGGRRLREPVDSGNTGSAGGPPSVDQLAGMSVDELADVDAQYGEGTVEKILSAAMSNQ